MNEHIDHAAGTTHVGGGIHEAELVRDIPSDRLREVVAEAWSWELLEALKAAVAGAAHWRPEAQTLLRRIANLEMPEPPR